MNKPEPSPNRDTDQTRELRVRAAWIYYVEGRTQSEVGEILGINRIAVNRLLAEARRKSEVQITVTSELSMLAKLERQLEDRYGLQRCVIAPLTQANADPIPVIAHAAAKFVSERLEPSMTIGVGWGRTLHSMLRFLDDRVIPDLRIVSLLGGISDVRRYNPAEFAWQFAQKFDAEGYLVPAPAVVDSKQTRTALVEKCGLDQIFELAERSDMALLSCGAIAELNTVYQIGGITDVERDELAAQGAVGDMMFTFLNADGDVVGHPLNDRCVAYGLAGISRIKERVLISGGAQKLEILGACLKAIRPTTLITDERTAEALLNH